MGVTKFAFQLSAVKPKIRLFLAGHIIVMVTLLYHEIKNMFTNDWAAFLIP